MSTKFCNDNGDVNTTALTALESISMMLATVIDKSIALKDQIDDMAVFLNDALEGDSSKEKKGHLQKLKGNLGLFEMF